MPFLPLYMAELGARGVGEVAFWSGISLGVTPAMTALLAPVWGRVADRVGAKLMLLRSIASFIVIMAAMAYVTKPWHVFALRALQGFFAGYGALALAMAAQSAEPGRLASALATVQTSQRLGPAVGPVIGGVLAQGLGLRHAFLVSALLYVVGLVMVMMLYREPPNVARQRVSTDGSVSSSAASPRMIEHLVVLMVVIFSMGFAERSLAPILPLYVVAIGFTPEKVPIMSGALFSVIAVTAAIGHHTCGPLLLRHSARATIAAGALTAALGVLLMLALPFTAVLLGAAAILGVSVGTAMTAAYTTGGNVMPEGMRATGFGMLSSASLTAMALSPVASGFIGGRSLRAVFLVDIVLLAIVALVVHRWMNPRAAAEPSVADTQTPAPPVDEE
jgi:DHA1 family multidrug resistance protein-like MFS transporter